MRQKTVEEPIHTIRSDNGEVFIITNKRRFLLAKCSVKIDIIEHSTFFSARNPAGYDVKNRYTSVVLCLDPAIEFHAMEDIEKLFEKTESYEIYFEVETAVGKYKRVKLDNLLEESVDLSENEWKFRIEDSATTKELLKL